ncbi:MAG: hypothetical protein C0502_03395 [Opitutus sp.]|nr:hypothetical protein [Opitutus sp.]
MGQETVTYLTNIVIAVILAGLLTHSWMAQGRTESLRCWMISAWIIATADMLFALRPELPAAFGRFAPTFLITLGQAGLLLGARATAGQTRPWGVLSAVAAIHAAVLGYFLTLDQPTHWRMVANGVVWAGLSLASFASLRKAPVFFWKPAFAPANVFLLHAAFHLLRLGFAIASATYDWTGIAAALQILGDLEASFFTVALFVALLIATLQLRHQELSSARAEVETLSGLLPICAWCKKVRDDAGYWQQVEDYFERRDRIRFTHGICADCADNFKDQPFEPSAPEQK